MWRESSRQAGAAVVKRLSARIMSLAELLAAALIGHKGHSITSRYHPHSIPLLRCCWQPVPSPL
jgi:hypothetical protein